MMREKPLSITQHKMLCKHLRTQLRTRAGMLQQIVQTIVLGRDASTKRIVDVSKWPVDKIHAQLARARAMENAPRYLTHFLECVKAQEETKRLPELLEELCRAYIDFLTLKTAVPDNLMERLWNFLLRACFERPFLLHVFPGEGTIASGAHENQQLVLMRETLDEFASACVM